MGGKYIAASRGLHSMSGSVTKGNRLQVMARRELEKQGYLVHTAVRSAQKRGPIWISQTTDIFNAFDLIATRIEPPQPLRFVQVTKAARPTLQEPEGVASAKLFPDLFQDPELGAGRARSRAHWRGGARPEARGSGDPRSSGPPSRGAILAKEPPAEATDTATVPARDVRIRVRFGTASTRYPFSR